ncbi:acetyltransferase [Gemmatimonadetes bacterium T265]|nr:acetyltransferase [Gemmatimonadetes bacterium T265]
MTATRAARVAERVTLRPPAPNDAAEFLALVQASAALHRPWVVAPDTPAAFRAYVARAAQEHDVYPGHVCRLVCRRADGAVLGAANLNNVVWGGLRCASLGYYAFAPSAGRGYVREGVARLLTHGFRRTGLHRVEAAVQPGNDRSRALLAALGFRHEGDSPRYLKLGGRWRDHERWAITADEWRPGRAAPSGGRPRAERILGP